LRNFFHHILYLRNDNETITTLSRELQNLAAGSTFLRRENSNELVAEVTDGFSASDHASVYELITLIHSRQVTC